MARSSSGAKAPPLAVRPYVASPPDPPLPHLLDGHRGLLGFKLVQILMCATMRLTCVFVLEPYAHICRQTKEKRNKTHIHKHAIWMNNSHPEKQIFI